ncbi:MAG: hypothetical protein JXA71_15360, partial [Chitinispirillaceae bacterium]|nr:hypothetical protein [Chitinispirillaceae bacterium]
MKRPLQISFILFFLALIYAVPMVQTVYEYRTNPGHRIQMLDLPRDLFVTPMERARGDVAMIDSLLLSVRRLEQELDAGKTA